MKNNIITNNRSEQDNYNDGQNCNRQNKDYGCSYGRDYDRNYESHSSRDYGDDYDNVEYARDRSSRRRYESYNSAGGAGSYGSPYGGPGYSIGPGSAYNDEPEYNNRSNNDYYGLANYDDDKEYRSRSNQDYRRRQDRDRN